MWELSGGLWLGPPGAVACRYYEETAHIPFVVSNRKWFPPRRHVDGLSSSIDLLPTLLGLAGRWLYVPDPRAESPVAAVAGLFSVVQA